MFREKKILALVEGKDVLDIGSVGQTTNYNLWDAYNTVELKSLTGIDLPNVGEENEKMFNAKIENSDKRIVYGNMETYSFNKKFDIIVAGDVLEHVNNQGLFLTNIRNHLKKDGVFVFTTPNAKWPTVILKPNATHTLWHDRYTLDRILSMNGFKIDEFHYYLGNKKRYIFPLNLLVLRQAMFVVCSKN